MDFFVAEDRARRASLLLAVLYLVSIAAVVVVTDAVLSCAIAIYTSYHSPISFSTVFVLLLPYLGASIALTVIFATILKARELRGGGAVFSSMLGGRFLSETPADPMEARLKNVVEEMAIAAGVKPPQICILDNEPGINAFAAGTNNHDPVIGVTAGCLTLLTRDELQAVVAHEFSHILHNDTTLNTRAYAIIFGLLAISVIGVKTISVLGRVRGGKGSLGPMLFIMAIGLILMAMGWLGGLAGRMIRAAIVRQREFLADASAVQYTRNADNVASALYKMASCGSHLRHSSGEEAEHFLFGAGAGGAWGKFGLTRTHPKAVARIQAVRPGFEPTGTGASRTEDLMDDPAGYGSAINPALPGYVEENANGDSLDDDPSTLGAEKVVLPPPPSPPPTTLLSLIPMDLRTAACSSKSVAILCFTVAAAALPTDNWTGLIQNAFGPVASKEALSYLPQIKTLNLKERVGLVDLAIPALRSLPQNRASEIVKTISQILPRTTQPDFIAMAVVWRLTRYLRAATPLVPAVKSWADGAHHISVVIASAARMQCSDEQSATLAYNASAQQFCRFGPMPSMPDQVNAGLANIWLAICEIPGAAPQVKDAVIGATEQIIQQSPNPASGAVILLRMLCDSADRDFPPAVNQWA